VGIERRRNVARLDNSGRRLGSQHSGRRSQSNHTVHASPPFVLPLCTVVVLQAAFFFATISLRLISASAIWMALSAAPLRRLSETTHVARPFSTVGSSRMRLIYVASSPAHSTGVT